MAFLDDLQSHRGGLLELKTPLYWYGRGWDSTPERLYLLLDAANAAFPVRAVAVADVPQLALRSRCERAAAHLLIDGRPQWVWVAAADVEFL